MKTVYFTFPSPWSLTHKRTSPLAVSVFFQDVVWAEPGSVGRLDLVPRRPRLGRSDRPWWESIPQAAWSVGFHPHHCLLPASQADIWEVSFLQLLACLVTTYPDLILLTSSCASFQDSSLSSCLPAGRAWQETGVCASSSGPGGLFLQYIETSHTGTHLHTHTHTE